MLLMCMPHVQNYDIIDGWAEAGVPPNLDDVAQSGSVAWQERLWFDSEAGRWKLLPAGER